MSFDAFAQRLEQVLDIPYPARREVLDELLSHLEGLRDDLVADGLDPEAATARALDTLAADQSFLDSMQSVHRTAIARALARLPRSVSLGLEYSTILAVGLLLLFTLFFEESQMIEFMLNGGFFMVPINLAGLAILFFGLERIYSLFIKQDHSAPNLDKRLLSLRFLAVACTLTGVVGTLVGFYQAFSMAESITERFGGVFPIYEVASIAMTTTIWGMTLALLAVIFRFVVEAKVSRIKAMRLS